MSTKVGFVTLISKVSYVGQNPKVLIRMGGGIASHPHQTQGYSLLPLAYEVQSTTSVMTPEPTVLPPSRMAKWLPMSRGTGLSRTTRTAACAPGIHITT